MAARRFTITIPTRVFGGKIETQEVEARTTCVRQLVIHKTFNPSPGEEIWSVTHAPTGLLAYKAHTLKEANRYAELVSGADWSFSSKQRRPPEDCDKAHAAAIREISLAN